MKSKFHGMNVEIILEETEDFKTAIDFAQPDDIVIIFFDKAEHLIDIIKIKLQKLNLKLNC